MAIIRIDEAGDLALENGNFVWLRGIDWVRQRLMTRFKFFQGEWFLDERLGVPYFRSVLVKNPDLGVVRSIFRRIILTTPGVISITHFEVRYNDSERHLEFEFTARATTGLITVTPEDREFIVDVAG